MCLPITSVWVPRIMKFIACFRIFLFTYLTELILLLCKAIILTTILPGVWLLPGVPQLLIKIFGTPEVLILRL